MISDWILPSKRNTYKAYLIRLEVVSLLTLLVCILNVAWFYTSYQKKQILGVQSSSLTVSEVIALTNLERVKAGSLPVTPNQTLNLAAQMKAENMVEAGVFDHYYESNSEYINPWQFILEAGYDYFYAGENLAKDFTTSQVLVQAWMDSPTHRENLLNPQYQDIGVAIIEGPYLEKENTTLVVQLFATSTQSVIEKSGSLPSRDPQAVKIAPILENDTSWGQSLISQYPSMLFVGTFLVTLLIGITLLIDSEAAKKRLTHKEISIDLWNH